MASLQKPNSRIMNSKPIQVFYTNGIYNSQDHSTQFNFLSFQDTNSKVRHRCLFNKNVGIMQGTSVKINIK